MPAQAPTTPAVIVLGDKKARTLRFSNGALKKLKEEFGASVFKGTLKDFLDKIDEGSLAKVLFLGLHHSFEGGDMAITQEDIDELVDAQMMNEVLMQLMIALGASFPEPKNETAPARPEMPLIPPVVN